MKLRVWAFFLILSFLCAGLCSCKTEVREGDTKWNQAVEPFRKTADMGGYRLSYLDMGTGEPVVMVHGFADSSYSWRENTQALMDAGNRLIIVDQPGHGLSDPPPQPYAYSVENQAKAVVALTETLGLKDFSLVGHCMGGGIALYIAEKYPGRIRRLAVIDPIAYEPPAMQILRLPGMEYLTGRFGGQFAVKVGLENSFYDSSRLTGTVVNEYYRTMSRPGYWKMLIAMEKDFYSPEFFAMVQNLPKILKPTLIIWGKQDAWVTPEEGRHLNGQLFNSTLRIIDRCGHNAHQECSYIVNPILADFLRAAGPLPDPHLMHPGKSMGSVSLGMTREDVRKVAGRALSLTRTAEQFTGFIVQYQDDKVSEILVTTPAYHTPEGIGSDSTVDGFLAAFPGTAVTCYQSRSGGQVANGVMHDAVEQGIAYDWNSYEGKRREETVTIAIHAPGTPAQVYGTVIPCKRSMPAGK